jgi:hypothetical protein
MSRRNKDLPKFGKCSTELLKGAKWLVSDYRLALVTYTKRKDTTYLNGIDNSSTAILRNSLTALICGWIDQTPDWKEKWQAVHERFQTCAFLQNGYLGFMPDLNWLFVRPSNGGERGIEKVLSGRYDRFTTTHALTSKWKHTEDGM